MPMSRSRRKSEAALVLVSETALLLISEAALLLISKAAVLLISETALLLISETALLLISETALLLISEAALRKCPCPGPGASRKPHFLQLEKTKATGGTCSLAVFALTGLTKSQPRDQVCGNLHCKERTWDPSQAPRPVYPLKPRPGVANGELIAWWGARMDPARQLLQRSSLYCVWQDAWCRVQNPVSGFWTAANSLC